MGHTSEVEDYPGGLQLYCKDAPPPVPICHGSLPAYTSNHYYDEYGLKVAMKDNINCHCSNDEEYETKYEYYRKHNVYVVSISYFCKQLNICSENEYCRSRVGRTSKYLTDTNCKCLFNYQCPAIKEAEAETFILNGIKIQGVKCRLR
ncbi:unnamed protein product [Lepeophtheirus salmonis]|uniref:(salmon louse) hypothetical protein n=1 Tax=Lepeophtheirus salmonis TaxID=72036 RepID=A0A7R8H1I1_LEPSM|nr:unnamed protein product [Lepeophtheirus salmonis]CAF2794738.1 unnamed protein product [Lepeophtheirus salmonis]